MSMQGSAYVSKLVDEHGFVNWSESERLTWKTLVERQSKVVKGKCVQEFEQGLKLLNISAEKMPQIPQISQLLQQYTGWRVQAVPALIQSEIFFGLLANKRFPAATFIRAPEQLDYLQEPDYFHEIYGHTPLLTNPAYANFIEKYGRLALMASASARQKLLRLFWFTIEFGMVETKYGTRAYGGGILSSIGETQYCMSNICEKREFNILETLRTPYRIDIMQPVYFVLEQFDDLFEILDQDIFGMIKKADVLGDRIVEFPTQEKGYHLRGRIKCSR